MSLTFPIEDRGIMFETFYSVLYRSRKTYEMCISYNYYSEVLTHCHQHIITLLLDFEFDGPDTPLK